MEWDGMGWDGMGWGGMGWKCTTTHNTNGAPASQSLSVKGGKVIMLQYNKMQ